VSSTLDLRDYDPFDERVLQNPYAWYQVLRDRAPCHNVAARGTWVISRYDDVVACAKNHGEFSSTGGVGPEWEQRPMMPMYDPPQHTRLRRLVSRPFQPNALAERAEHIGRSVDRLMDQALEAKRLDLVADLAVPLSLGVIADLIGVPEDRRDDLRRWSLGVVEDLGGGLAPDGRARVEELRKEFVTFLRTLVATRRASADEAAKDVISLILAAADTEQLNEKETIAFCVLLLVAGFETTVNAIANAALALVEFPEQWNKLTVQPTLVKTMIEEAIRFDGPVQAFFRNTTKDTAVAGVAIPKGVKVMLLFGSANRDERRFAAPDDFRVERPAGDHIGYGVGVHYCLGAPLARAQLAAVWSAFAQRVRRFEIDGEVARSHNVLFRGVRRLPLRLEAR
jgi:cytochrome P450